jgi:hypothetical protein
MALKMNNKFCPICKQNKVYSDFYVDKKRKNGLYPCCKFCSNLKSKKYHNKNKERINKRSREYAEKNKEQIKSIRAKRGDKLREYQRNYSRNRCATDPLYKFKKNIRRSTSEAFRFSKKSKTTLKILGCSLEEAFAHIESLFQPEMTWLNYGSKWHIDHIVPLSSAYTIEQVEKLCHYSNLQPLWAKENIIKSDKLDWKPSMGNTLQS